MEYKPIKSVTTKRILFILFVAIMSTIVYHIAMSNSRVRKETRLPTDKMAHEPNLNTIQYNDVYGTNCDFISDARYLMDDVLRGEEWALNRYYDYLDVRNDDLRRVSSSRQYPRLMQAIYSLRPIYMSGGRWPFRIYATYSNPNHFCYPRPHHYRTYCGGYYRTHHHNVSYYRRRHSHPVYNGPPRIRDNKPYHTSRRTDFGSANTRPNSNMRLDSGTHPNSDARPGVGQSDRRPGVNDSTRRSGIKKEVSKPRREWNSQRESVRRNSSSSSSIRGTRASSRSSDRDNDAMRRN